ncbi:hypothetical protein ACVW8M_001193 [Morganella morganii]
MRLLTFLLSSSFCLSGYAAGGSLNGYYNCDIPSASYQRKQGAMRDFYFPDKQRKAVVLFHDDRFTVLDTKPAPYHSPALTPITQFATMSKQDLQEIGEDTLIYAGISNGLAYFTPSKQRFVFGLNKRGGGNNGSFLLELQNCRRTTH